MALLAPLGPSCSRARRMCFPFSDKRTKRQRTRLTHLVLASVHFDHIQAKKTTIIAAAVKSWLESCELHQVDLLGFDLNQGLRAFETALRAAGHKSKLLLCRPSTEVGFLIPPGSQLMPMAITGFRHFGVPNEDLGWRPQDCGSHFFLGLHLRPGQRANERKRTNDAAFVRKKRHKKRRRQVLKDRRRNRPEQQGPQVHAGAAAGSANEMISVSSGSSSGSSGSSGDD